MEGQAKSRVETSMTSGSTLETWHTFHRLASVMIGLEQPRTQSLQCEGDRVGRARVSFISTPVKRAGCMSGSRPQVVCVTAAITAYPPSFIGISPTRSKREHSVAAHDQYEIKFPMLNGVKSSTWKSNHRICASGVNANPNSEYKNFNRFCIGARTTCHIVSIRFCAAAERQIHEKGLILATRGSRWLTPLSPAADTSKPRAYGVLSTHPSLWYARRAPACGGIKLPTVCLSTATDVSPPVAKKP